MILRKLTATFGKLEQETLELKEGLNILSAPNEWGKSTWSAFLLAMFYGVDTSERNRSDRLAAKEKYAPWSGKTMSGSVELTWQGRNITIQRTSKGRVPLGVFEAFDTDTGEKLPEITAENCGVTLLGAERAVFVRSAFIGQSAIAVDQNAELDKRLHSLASTGEETVSCSDTQRRLHEWDVHISRNGTGSISKEERALAGVNEKLDTIRMQHEKDLLLADQSGKLEEQEQKLRTVCESLRAGELLKRRAQLDAAEKAAEAAKQAAGQAESAAAGLPDENAMQELDDCFDRLLADRAALHRTEPPITPPEPSCSPVFSGSTPEEAQRRARTDADAVRKLQTPMKTSSLWIAALALLLLGGVLAVFWKPVIGLAVCGAGLLLLALYLILQGNEKRAWQTRQEEAKQILRNYRAEDAEEILAASVRYGEALRQHEKDVERIHALWRARNEELSRLDKTEKELLDTLHTFSPETKEAAEAKQAIREARQRLRSAEDAAAASASAERTLRSLQEAFGELPDIEPPEEDYSGRISPEDAERALADLRGQLETVRAALAESRGRVESCGDPAALEAEREARTERIGMLRRQSAALNLAQEALAEANRQMQARFSPQLSKLAGKYLSDMTDKRYEKLLLDQNFALTAKAADETAVHPLIALSGGTAEQVYFALRLAICTLALEKDTPIVLDDAFVFFDDERLRQAMKLLRKEAKTRQILLFSCQSREQKLIK